MINSAEILATLRINGLDQSSSLEKVDTLLSQLKYSDAEKIEIKTILKSQGWFPGINISAVPNPVVDGGVKIPPIQTRPLSPKSHKKIFISILIFLLVLLVVGGGAYAFVMKIGPFAGSSYTEDNFMSSLLEKFAQIDSASYAASGALSVVQRDADAVPFTLKVSNEAEMKKKYFYDSERMTDASGIISRLNNLSNYSTYVYSNPKIPAPVQKSYPDILKTIVPAKNDKTTYYGNFSITDPETDNEYEYKVTEGGKNFLLTINFGTNAAIKAIKSYGYVATTTIIEGKKVSFTKNSRTYNYMPSEPPQPFLVTMSDSLRTLTSDVNVKMSVSASSEFKKDNVADWLFNIDAEGSFGDLTYKVNVDALKKDDNYYFKINNIPSLFLFGGLGSVKGKWVSIPSKVASTTATSSDFYSYSELSYIQKGIPEQEKKYKENREKFVKFIRKVATIADEEKLVLFKNKPKSEKVDGRVLTRYDLSIRKEKILPFYTKVQEVINTDPDFSDYKDSVDQGLIDYLKSDEFNQVFDYFDKNNNFVFWTDQDGFPAILQNTMRVVPPDTATQLEGKQINLVFKFVFSNINKPIDIKAPSDAVPIEKLIKDANLNTSSARINGKTAVIMASLNSIRPQAEILYDKGNSYGKKIFKLGACKNTADTLFADSLIVKNLESATEKNISSATCVSSGTIGNVTSYAISVPLPDEDGFSFCIDSTGASKKIIGVLKGEKCK